MSLRALAEADLGLIVEDPTGGFGWPVTFTDPDGVEYNLTAFTNDRADIIDPDTGTAVSGTTTTVAYRISSMVPRPVSVHDENSLPWLCSFEDVQGTPTTYRVMETRPDDGLGLMVCFLEPYTP